MAYESILAGPLRMFLADEGTARPTGAPKPVNPVSTGVVGSPGVGGTYPGTDWTLFADEFYDEEGLGFDFTETINYTRILNKTLPVVAHRSEEDFSISVGVKDLSLETLSLIMNDSTLTNTAATATIDGYKSFEMTRGHVVSTHALLVIGDAPYADSKGTQKLQFYFPLIVIEGPESFQMMLGDPSVLNVTFKILDHPTIAIAMLAVDDPI